MRTHVPFDVLWSMPIDVPYSLLVRDGGSAWTCGQIALDQTSSVLHPGDLVAQTRCVCDYIDEILERGGLARNHPGKLVAYYVERRAGDRAAMLDVFRERYGATPLIVPVAVPYYYYEGLEIEVDVFAGTSPLERHGASSEDGRVAIDIVDAGEQVWAAISMPGDGGAGSDIAADAFIADALARLDLDSRDLLAEHWFVPAATGDGFTAGRGADGPRSQGLMADAGAAVMTGGATTTVTGELTFVRGADPTETRVDRAAGDTRVTSRRKGRFLWVAGRCDDPDAGLVEQTRRIMDAISDAIGAQGMSFADAVKSTTHYVGSDAPEELHDNMAVRNARYTRPGPASTGLPVCALGDRHSRTAIDIVFARAAQG